LKLFEDLFNSCIAVAKKADRTPNTTRGIAAEPNLRLTTVQ